MKNMIDYERYSKKINEIDFRANQIVGIVLQAGNKVVNMRNNNEEGVVEKGDEYVGYHAIVTPADKISQKIILKELSKKFLNSFFITEEKEEKNNRILNQNNYNSYLNQNIFGVDPIDGTSQYNNGLYEWSLSVGEMNNLNHNKGIIYAPQINGGLLVFGIKGKGVYIIENGRLYKTRITEDKEEKKSMVYFGVDIALDEQFNLFVNKISNQSRTTNVIGSCALGLALVASGKVDALIQPTQRVWDWFGGYPLVEEAGGKFQFYRFKEGKIELAEKPLQEDYNPKSRNLGFIAGNKNLVNRLTEQLIELYNK